MKTWVILISTLISIAALAEENGSKGRLAAKTSNAIKLPHCVNDSQEVDTIKSTIKLNSKTENKYNGYIKALSSDSDKELMARLIYAETKGTNCDDQSEKVSSVITTVISNRIKIRKGHVKSVIFERDQFASSLNIYSESHYKEFLCPSDAVVWNMALRKATAALSDKSKPTTTVNYFLYKHSPRWTKEPWKLAEDTSINSVSARACIKAFKNPNYK